MTFAQPDSAVLLRHDQEGICTLTLNRPQARNALSRSLMTALQEQLDALAGDHAIKVIVLAGTGPAFCAGHDLKEVRGLQTDAHRALFRQCSHLMMTLVRMPKPVIARVHGMASAAGCQLVASCDLAYAAEEAQFATPGVNIGLFCSTPMVAISRAIPRKAMMEMLLTGTPISARKALTHGLVNDVVSAADLDYTVDSIARGIAAKSPRTLAIGKEAFYNQLDLSLSEAYAYAGDVMTRNMALHDAEEGIDAFLEKRSPLWTGQ